MKGVILAGGTGSRLGALTRATNKHLLPLGPEPMVCRAARTLAEAGVVDLARVADVAVVTGAEHYGAFARLFPQMRSSSVQLLCQERPGGIAHAIEVAREWAAGEPIVVLLADNIWEHPLCPWVEAFRHQRRGARVLLSRTDDLEVLAQVAVPTMGPAGIERIDEKPASPPSRYAVTGTYCFDEGVWDILPRLRPSARGELEIADVLNFYAARGVLEHDVIDGWWADAGGSIADYYAALDFVRGQESA